jgi:P63C domain
MLSVEELSAVSTTTEDADAREAGRALSKLGAAKGGRARAESLPAEERREIARRAARARWAKEGKAADNDKADQEDLLAPLVAPRSRPGSDVTARPYSMFSGTLHIADVAVQCHVLDDSRRVLTQREVVRALSGGRVSGSYLQRIPGYDVATLQSKVIQFSDPRASPNNHGFEATLLTEICEAYLDARAAGSLHPSQRDIALAAEMIVRACARVGIIALVDEATGYQEVRARNALQVKLQLFIAEQMGEWAKRFPDEFWIELARLEGIKYSGRNRPWRWGKYVMKFVYSAIDPDVAKKLASVNPDPAKGHNHHQLLTGFGQKQLNDHLQQVVAVMRLSGDMDDFKRKFTRAFPKAGYAVQLELTGGSWDF